MELCRWIAWGSPPRIGVAAAVVNAAPEAAVAAIGGVVLPCDADGVGGCCAAAAAVPGVNGLGAVIQLYFLNSIGTFIRSNSRNCVLNESLHTVHVITCSPLLTVSEPSMSERVSVRNQIN